MSRNLFSVQCNAVHNEKQIYFYKGHSMSLCSSVQNTTWIPSTKLGLLLFHIQP